MSNVVPFLVRYADGSLNFAETCSRFEAELVKYASEREVETQTIANAVDAVFDAYPALVKMNVPALITMTLVKMNAQPENHKVLSDRIHSYIRDNAQGEIAEDGTQERPSSKFLIGKGKGGGVGLRARIEAEKAAKK
jgi:hypothetical protein